MSGDDALAAPSLGLPFFTYAPCKSNHRLNRTIFSISRRSRFTRTSISARRGRRSRLTSPPRRRIPPWQKTAVLHRDPSESALLRRSGQRRSSRPCDDLVLRLCVEVRRLVPFMQLARWLARDTVDHASTTGGWPLTNRIRPALHMLVVLDL